MNGPEAAHPNDALPLKYNKICSKFSKIKQKINYTHSTKYI